MVRRTDAVADAVTQWSRERPDLDASPMAVVGRIHRLAAVLDTRLRSPFADAGLAGGDFDLLAALRRSGKPYRLSPGDLAKRMLVTNGAVTKRVDRLTAQSLVTRSVSGDDGRGRDITLTAAGRALVDRLIGTHLDNERALLSGLTRSQRATLADLLAVLLGQVEAETPRAAGERE